MSDRKPIYSKELAGWVGDVDEYGDEFFAMLYPAGSADWKVIDLGSFPNSLAAIAAVDNLLHAMNAAPVAA